MGYSLPTCGYSEILLTQAVNPVNFTHPILREEGGVGVWVRHTS